MKAPSEEIYAKSTQGHNVEKNYIRLPVVGSQIHEISRNSERIRAYSRSRPSKVIDLGVINSNLGRIYYHFRDIDA